MPRPAVPAVLSEQAGHADCVPFETVPGQSAHRRDRATPVLRPRRVPGRLALAIGLSAVLLSACGGSNDDPPPSAQACEVTANGTGVVVGSGVPGDPSLPEPSSGYRLGQTAKSSRTYMVVTANPLATRAGCDTLKAGGSAVDAAISAQAMLGLVEPQSSGLGGGTFMMVYDAASRRVIAYDGRETAPAAATGDYLRWQSDSVRTAPVPSARASGRSIGTPGTVRLLELAHQRHGRLPWPGLFQAAITTADAGFPISGRLADAISGARADLLRDPDAVAYFLEADRSARKLGTPLRNPAYAQTLRSIADGGANAFYTGPIATDIVAKIQVAAGGADAPVPITPGLTTVDDLSRYQALARDPICSSYRAYWVCGMPPPSSGGLAVAQALGILEQFNLASHPPSALDIYGGRPAVLGVHLVSEAERLAYADRNVYVADTDFVPLPGGSPAMMLDPAYLQSRAARISLTASMGVAPAGVFAGAMHFSPSADMSHGTSHVSIVDPEGNAVSMTTTVEAGMGSFHFTRGFLLNNQLTDFSAAPSDADGPIANRVEALKRPRSSMAPTLVFRKAADGSRGDLAMVTGSPGGATIIQFVLKTLVGVIDWNLDAQQATSMIDFGAANTATTNVGGEHPNVNAANNGDADPLVIGLRGLGHTVSVAAQSSGISTIVRVDGADGNRYQGGADPRREGIVLGD